MGENPKKGDINVKIINKITELTKSGELNGTFPSMGKSEDVATITKVKAM